MFEGGAGLGVPPIVEEGYVLHAGDRAKGRAGLASVIFMPHVLPGVLLKGDGRVTALLRAVVDQAVLTDVQIAAAGAATPLPWNSTGDILLEPVEAGIRTLPQTHNLLENFLLLWAERLELSAVVMQNAHGRSKAQLECPPCDNKCIFRMMDRTAQNGIDIDLENRVPCQED